MTFREFEFLRKKLNRVVYFAFVDMRNLAVTGATEQIRDLAEVAEMIPEYLARKRPEDLQAIHGGLELYAEKYGGLAQRLLRVLFLDESSFDELYSDASDDANGYDNGDCGVESETSHSDGSRWAPAK